MLTLPLTRARGLMLAAIVGLCVPAASASAAVPTMYVDKDSIGGGCSDARSAAQASSPSTPWCSLARAVAAAPGGGIVYVRRGSHGKLAVADQARAAVVTIAASPGESVTIDGFEIQRSSNFRIQGFRVTSGGLVGLSSQIQVAGNDFSPRGLVVRAVRSSLVEGNVIHDIRREAGEGAPDGYGVWANGYWNGGAQDGIDGLVFRNNLFRNIPNDGIQLGGGPSRVKNVTIEGNEFAFVRRTIEADHSDSIQVIGGENIVIHSNYMHDSEVALLVKDAPTWGLVLENNLMVGAEGGGIQAQLWDTPGARVVNNTIWSSKLGGLRFADESEVSAVPSGIVVRNNIIDKYDNGSSAWIGSEDYNLILSGDRDGAHDLGVAPRFEGLFELAHGSAGIDAASPTLAPTTDRLGRPRSNDPTAGGESHVDMGAHERTLPRPPELAVPPAVPPRRPTRRKGARTKGSSRVRVSRSGRRDRSKALAGRTVSGRVFIFVRAPLRTKRVSFWLDDRARKGRSTRTDRRRPFDLRGRRRRARPFNTHRLTNGKHTLTVRIVGRGRGKAKSGRGRSGRRRARARLITVSFRVQN